MDSRIYIIHTASDTEWVKILIEYLQASSAQPMGFESNLISSHAASIQIEEQKELKPELFRADRIIAKVSTTALSDPEFNFQLGSAWALNNSVIALVDAQLLDSDLPASLSRVTRMRGNGPRSIIDLAKRVLPQYVETKIGATVLTKLSGMGFETPEETVEEVEQEKYKDSDTLQGIPSVLPDANLSASDESNNYPFFLEALDAGLAFSDCLFNRDEISDFYRELDQPFGTFFNSLGGNWASLRGLNDIDLWNGAVDNLLETLPLERQHVTNWYAVGFHLSTLLNIAGRDLFTDVGHRDSVQAQWDNTLDAFRFVASAAEIPEEDVDSIQSMLENLIGPSSNREYANVAKSRELVRQLAAAANYPG